MNKEPLIPLSFKPEIPPSLAVIIENNFSNNFKDEFGNEHLEKIKEFKTYLDNGGTPDDLGLLFLVDAAHDSPKDAQHEAFARYMALTLYWHEKQHADAAWFYYAKAQYHLGVFLSWDIAINHLTEQDIARQAKAKAAKIKHQKTNEPIMSEFTRIIVEKKPTNGWKSKKELINVAMPILEKLYKNQESDSFPLFEDLEKTIKRWLDTASDATYLYAINAARENPDWHPAPKPQP